MRWRLKKKIYSILEYDPADDTFEQCVNVFMISLILLNIVAVILETVEGFHAEHEFWFKAFEVFSVVIFTVEYVLRLWACTVEKRYDSPLRGRIRYALTPLAIVDFIVIVPFYLPMFLPIDLRFARAFRLLRLFKMTRYSESMKTLGRVFRERRHELALTIFLVLILLVTASSLMYFVENEAQPQAFSSIPAAMWWGMVTLTTVGYGDIYPVTPVGKVLGACIALLGVGMFALPAGIIGSGFVEEYHKRRESKPLICPHCGLPIDDVPAAEVAAVAQDDG